MVRCSPVAATPQQVGACVEANDPHCAISYRAAEIDPQTLAVRRLIDGTGTRDFGFVTIGLDTPEALWLGAARGTCVAKVSSARISRRRRLSWMERILRRR